MRDWIVSHFRGKSGDYCLQEEETMVQDRKWKSNAASLGLWNNSGTSPLIFRAATFLLAKSSQVLKCWGVAGAWCDRRISLMTVWLWELFENLFTFVVPEVEKPKESIRVEVRWGRDVPGVVRFHHLLSATGPLSLRPSVHRPFVHRPPSDFPQQSLPASRTNQSGVSEEYWCWDQKTQWESV